MRFTPVLRSVDILMVAVLIGTVVWTFKVKHDSQQAIDRVATLEKQIEAEKNRVDLLKSDWSLLTSPARLERLVEHYGAQLELRPIEPAQLADDNSLPGLKRPEPLIEDVEDEDFAQDPNVDADVTTGSIGNVGIPSPRGNQ